MSLTAKARENERRNANFKHGGARRAQAAAEGLSDEDILAMEGDSLSDDEILAMEGGAGPVDDRGDAEKGAGWAINILDTVTPSWGDEIVAAPAALWGGYDKEQEKAKRIQTRYRELEPWDSKRNLGSSALGLIGGVGPATAAYKGILGATRALTTGAPAASTIGKAAQAATGLAGTGALYNTVNLAGDAEGGPRERLEAIGADAGTAPLIGAGLGVAAGGLGAGGSRLAQRGFQAFRSGENQAARYLAEKLLGAGQSVDDLAAAHAKAAGTGKPVALGDVGPQGIKDAGAAAARTPGPGRETAQQTIVPRQEGQVGRVSDDVAGAVGGKPGSFTQTVDDISAQRAAEAKPLYDKAMHTKPLVSKKIVEITNRPSGKAAMDRGLRIARDEGIPESELYVRDARGNITGYTTKALHYMKMGLDDMIESAQRSGDNAAGRAYTIMKRELLGEVDRLNPAYAQARKVFAGHAANLRALESGRKAVNLHPDQIKSELSNMSQAEQEMYRRGFAQRIIEDVEKTADAGNAARRIFGNTAKRERMRAVLGDDEYNRLAERLGVEDAMYGSYRRTNVGSETAERISAQSDIDEFVATQNPQLSQGFVQSLASGSIAPLIRSISTSGVANLLRGLSQRSRGHIAKMLFSSKPEEVKAALHAISKEYAAARRFQMAQDAAVAQMTAQEKGRAAGGVAATGAYGYSPVQPF